MKLYEPISVLKPVEGDLWIVDGPAVTFSGAGLSLSFPTRMVIVRLTDATLWIWSPIELTRELGAKVDALGVVRHIVSPNKLHYVHVSQWKTAYPDAWAWASPGVRERAAKKRVDVGFDRDLGDGPDAAWAKDIDQLVFRGGRFMEEVTFFHRATRTLILADMIENFESDRLTFSERLLTRLGGVLDPDGKAPSDMRATFIGRHAVARASFESMLAWNPERVVIAHGRWYDRDGVNELRRAFRWLA